MLHKRDGLGALHCWTHRTLPHVPSGEEHWREKEHIHEGMKHSAIFTNTEGVSHFQGIKQDGASSA